jgi:hypothetical protein
LLGFTNFYQCFIAHYSSIVAPFIQLTRKINLFLRELKLIMPFNLWKLLS